jgi:ketosteroid isomerase-like protein
MAGRALSMALAEHALNLRADRAFDQLQDLLSLKVSYKLAGDRRLMPYAGSFFGRTDVSIAFAALDVEFEVRDLELADFVAEESSVAVRWTARWVNRGTRDFAFVPGFSLLRFVDGVVVEWVDFLDTAGASYLAGWMPDMPAFAMAGPAGQ